MPFFIIDNLVRPYLGVSPFAGCLFIYRVQVEAAN